MQRVYLDNAATTPLDPQVVQAMHQAMTSCYGNPSSIHALGREARTKIEKARKSVAEKFGVNPSEIFFTSGGTEADNMAIWQSVVDLQIKHVISSPLEHHAVLHTLDQLEKRKKAQIHYLDVDKKGNFSFDQLEALLKKHPSALVTLMHANNEIGNLIDLNSVANLCKQYSAIFHSDTVQTIGHYTLNLKEIGVDMISCSAHKFHGPKGVGFIYINEDINVNPLIYGGAQERNMRGGTENIYGIIGLEKALTLALDNLEEHQSKIKALKAYMIEQLQKHFQGAFINGMGKEPDHSLCTVLNVSLPPTSKAEMLLFSLDIEGVCCSAGSACSSGAQAGSHVLRAIQADMQRPNLRFSFSRFTNTSDIDFAIAALKKVLQ